MVGVAPDPVQRKHVGVGDVHAVHDPRPGRDRMDAAPDQLGMIGEHALHQELGVDPGRRPRRAGERDPVGYLDFQPVAQRGHEVDQPGLVGGVGVLAGQDDGPDRLIVRS